MLSILKWALIAMAAVFVLVEASGYIIAARGTAEPASVDSAKDASTLKAQNAKLQTRLRALGPKGVYIVVDTGGNRLYVKNANEITRECLISSGSGNVLEDTSAGRKWVFDTPRGEFSVKSKALAPAWIKPDWAFVEEGEKAPKKYSDRVERGVLGDYALGFGNGYFIHGTLYTRMLGRNVTHGCIRMGDDDLAAVFKVAPMGTKLFIF